MNRPLKVLILEDVQADAELMVHELKQAGLLPDWIRVDMGGVGEGKRHRILFHRSLQYLTFKRKGSYWWR